MQNASHISQLIQARAGAMPFARALAMLGSAVAVALACAALSPEAHAQEVQPQQPARAERALQQQRELQREMQRQEMLRQEQRAYEEQQRRILQAQQEQQQQEGQRRTGRMTADERLELRRQINEANQDIYARPRGRR